MYRGGTKRIVASYKFFRKDTQEWIETPEEVWGWEAQYEDGQILKQFADDGIFHQFSEINQAKLAVFKMTSKVFPQTYSLLFSDPAMKPIHFYRNTILNASTELEERSRYYCFGYEKKIGSRTHKCIMIITPANELLVTEDSDLV